VKYDSTVYFENELIFDLKLKKNDTLKIRSNKSGFAKYLIKKINYIDTLNSYRYQLTGIEGHIEPGMGNYFDWIPVYRDKEFNGLLYNCNSFSNNYKKFAVWVCDDNEKIGINILNDNIEEIKHELENYYIEWINENNPNSLYSLPLFKMVRNRNLEYYF
jgi:hypothetical protein